MKSLRVYIVRHHGDRRSGVLLRRREMFFEEPAPSAFGATDEEVLAQLEAQLIERIAKGDTLERYLWDEHFETRPCRVDVHPMSALGGRLVIGKQQIPLRLTFAWSPLPAGGYLVILPRFGWRFVVEELSLAVDVIREQVASSFAGESARWIYEYREEGDESLRAWSPPLLDKREARLPPHDDAVDFPELARVAEELVQRAARRQLAPVVGVDARFEPIAALLDRDPTPSILLVGPPGSGKSAFVRRMAQLFLDRSRGKRGDRRKTRLWATSADRLLAGMTYLGMWQKRVLALIEELSGEGDVLYVDRLGELLRTQPDGSSIAELLAPAVTAGDITLVAECDATELERCRRRAPAFVDAFHLVSIEPLAPAALLPLMEQYQRSRRPELSIHAEALRRLLAHLDAFRPDQSFPGKALSFLDWLTGERERGRVDARAMSEAFARWSGLPAEIVDDARTVPVEAVAAALQKRVIGQDEACVSCARVVTRLKAGLQDPERPIAALFFTGPTGVGKTELAKQLAAYLFGDERRMVRIDMSEYMLGGSSQRLLEAGPGVRSLVQRVRAEPLSLVLLDEIDKAHPEVFDVLLPMLGEGRLTDTAGRLVDFRMTIVVMTANLGADARRLGFASLPSDDHRAAVLRHFRTELVARLDRVVSFLPLGRDDVERIVHLEIARVARRPGLRERNITLHLDPSGRSRLADLGYHPAMGARPLKRIIEDRIVAPLAVKLAADPTMHDTTFVISTRGDAPHVLVV